MTLFIEVMCLSLTLKKNPTVSFVQGWHFTPVEIYTYVHVTHTGKEIFELANNTKLVCCFTILLLSLFTFGELLIYEYFLGENQCLHSIGHVL